MASSTTKASLLAYPITRQADLQSPDTPHSSIAGVSCCPPLTTPLQKRAAMGDRCAIYIRVSTEEQAREGISIEAQKDRCVKYCEAKGWPVFRVYEDAGFSAGSTKRPAFRQLLEDVRKREFATLLVYKVDRFSRNLKDLITVLEELKSHGVNFTSVTEPIDTTSAIGEAFFQIIGVFAQLERGMVKERVELAFGKKIDSGEVLNRAPLGYYYNGGKLTIQPDEAAKVREIFQMWAAGVNYKEIAAQFSLPTSTLYDLIKNPTYIGKVRYRGKLFKGSHQPLIEDELFFKVNKKEQFETSEHR